MSILRTLIEKPSSPGGLFPLNTTALKSTHEAGGRGGEALRAGGGADFIFSAPERVVMAFSRPAGALVCLRGVLCGGERVRA